MANNNAQGSLTQSVTRALKILTCFTDETPLLRVTDISNRLRLTPSLVSRLLTTLEHEGCVERDEETGFYRLGRTIITLAGVALNHNRLRMEALSEMEKVSYALGLGVNLAVLDQDSIFYLVRVRRDEAYLGAMPPGASAEHYFLRPPYRALYSAYFETAFVKIITSDGVTGWGEALAPVSPDTVCTIIEQLLAPVLRGRDPLAGDVLWTMMYDLMRERGHYGGFMLDAISACDTALWDLRGKLLGQPVYVLAGGAYRATIPCYVSGLPRPNDEARAALALAWTERGFHHFKLAAGYGVEADSASIAVLRRALGDEARLLLDAHWVYTLDESVRLARRLEALNGDARHYNAVEMGSGFPWGQGPALLFALENQPYG